MNHYETLGVAPDATEQQIKEAYRREAMKCHPDRHDSAGMVEFQKLRSSNSSESMA